MIKAEKLSSGKYRARATYYDSNGKQHSKSFTAKTAAKAVAAAEQFQEEYKYKSEPTNLTLKEAMIEYINRQKLLLSPSTINGYRIIAQYRFLNLQERLIKNITPNDIQNAINEEYQNGLSPKTIKNSYSFLSSALKDVCNIRIEQVIKLPKEKKEIKTLPDISIVYDILNAMKGSGVEIPVTLAITLGLRMSEIRGLKWEDFNGEQLYIHRVKIYCGKKDIVKETTKTEAGTRIIILPNSVIELLDNTPHISEYIVTLSYGSIYNRYARALKAHNLPKMSFHFLRHINASIMLEAGVPDRYAMQRGGWATNSVYKYVYAHTINKESQKYERELNEKFDKIITKKSTI